MLDTPVDFSLLKKVVIDFYSDWCGPCQKISKKYLELSNEYTDLFFYKINIDVYRQLAEEYNVRTIPCFITLIDGKEHSRLAGMSETKLEELVKELREK